MGSLGKVYFVGAGPGDPGLITVRGLEILKSADCVLYDGLVNPALMMHSRSSSEKICVGKHGRLRVWSQGEINEQLINQCKQGKRVVRLKGGDPAVFARTAEELEALLREGISYEIIPGITAGLAASSFAGIPVTHRDWASAVALVTAHGQTLDGGLEADESLDWDSLARFPGTLIFYMGVTKAQRWSRKLIEAGKDGATPVALVRKVSLPDQKVVHCRLDEVGERMTPASSFRPPVVAMVGEVTSLGPSLDWFSKRPLFGVSILLTRPADPTDSWTTTLRDLGAEVLHQSAIEIFPSEDWDEIDDSIRQASEFDWILFSSRHGVEHWFERLWKIGFDHRQLGGAQFGAVGPSTAEKLASYRVRCDLMPSDEWGAGPLLEQLRSRVYGKKCLVVRGSRGDELLREGLTQMGAKVCSLCVYQNVDVANADEEILNRMTRSEIDFATVTSSSIARSMDRLYGEKLGNTKLISVSPKVSALLKDLGWTPFVELNASQAIDPALWLSFLKR